MAFRWQANDGPTLNAGLVFEGIRTSIAKKPLYFCNFSGGEGGVTHAGIQESSSGGVQVSLTQKSSDVFFFCFVFFFLVLSLFYRSQMVNFKKIYHFSRFQRGSNIFQGGGGGGGVQLFPGGGGGGVQLLIPYRNPKNL